MPAGEDDNSLDLVILRARPEDLLAQASYLKWRVSLWRRAMLGSSPSMTEDACVIVNAGW